MATGLGVPIDVVAGGGEDINAPLLAQMCRASPGGKLWAHPGYGATFPSALRAALQRRFGAAGVLDCRCSNGLKLAQYLGPVEGLPAK
ncbi:protein transport protein SEC23, partial [Haematococcus lacustris]